ncbi:MAG: hypothetical protein II802_01440, partial [Clostridia bacterium]|nr:hypothetical protein [Clostridia bacterium]
VGKYPGFVLNISVPFEMVDVNVHPAKIEVRFSDEKRIFDAVYAAVMNALSTGDTRPEISVKQNVFNPFERMTTEQFRQQSIEDSIEEKDVSSFEKAYKSEAVLENSNTPMRLNDLFLENSYKIEYPSAKEVVKSANPDLPRKELSSNEKTEQPPILDEDVRLIGEAFKTYIIVQKGESVFMIDKHAAHERILFNGLKKQARAGVQILLTPLRIDMPKEEYDSIINNLDLLSKSGFEVEDFGNGCILVREVPANLTDNGIEQLMSEIALSLKSTSSVQIDRLDDIYHTVACKAAIKAGSKTSDTEMLNLAKKVLSDRNVMYCPHGRPVAFEIKKRELEKQFGRIQ